MSHYKALYKSTDTLLWGVILNPEQVNCTNWNLGCTKWTKVV